MIEESTIGARTSAASTATSTATSTGTSTIVAGTTSVPAAINGVSYLVADTRSGAPLLSDFSSSTSAVDGHGASVAFRKTSERLASADRHWPLQAPFASVSVRGTPAAPRMTLLDLALMMLFGVGLVAYQLERKQRLLRQSSLVPSSLD